MEKVGKMPGNLGLCQEGQGVGKLKCTQRPKAKAATGHNHLMCDRTQAIYFYIPLNKKGITAYWGFQSTKRNRTKDNLWVPRKLFIRLNKPTQFSGTFKCPLINPGGGPCHLTRQTRAQLAWAARASALVGIHVKASGCLSWSPRSANTKHVLQAPIFGTNSAEPELRKITVMGGTDPSNSKINV